MSELPSHFVAQEPADLESSSEDLLNPELVKARLYAQTIKRFQALYWELELVGLREYETAQQKLDALALEEYGKVWEVLKESGVEPIPMMIGGIEKVQLKEKLIASGYKLVVGGAEKMLDSPDFVTLSRPEATILVRLTVSALGFSKPATLDQVYRKVSELGLELCPAEVGPWYRLQTPNQYLMNPATYVGMKPITLSDGGPRLFCVGAGETGHWLVSEWQNPDSEQPRGREFLFRLPVSTKDEHNSIQ